MTVHEEPVILVVMELPVDDAGHQQEGPGPASPPGFMMQQLPTPEVLCEEQAPSVPRITIVQARMTAPALATNACFSPTDQNTAKRRGRQAASRPSRPRSGDPEVHRVLKEKVLPRQATVTATNAVIGALGSRDLGRCYGSMSPRPMNAPLRLALAVAVVAGGLLAVGCHSSSGPDAVGPTIQGCPATQPVDISTLGGAVGGAVPACSSGYAHASVCCQAGPSQPTICTECPAAPFGVCDQDSLTFPDPGSCCSLDDGGCSETSGAITPLVDTPFEGGVLVGVPGGDCYYPCGPGGYPPGEPGDSAPGGGLPACADVLDGSSFAVTCLSCCTPGGCPTNSCNCPAEGPCVCGPQCGGCPAGWQVPLGGTDLCCRTNSAGVKECFSQATSITANPIVQ